MAVIEVENLSKRFGKKVLAVAYIAVFRVAAVFTSMRRDVT
jgi:hypothetical protein